MVVKHKGRLPFSNTARLFLACKLQVPVEALAVICDSAWVYLKGLLRRHSANLWSYFLAAPTPISRLRFVTLGWEAKQCHLGSLDEECQGAGLWGRRREGGGPVFVSSITQKQLPSLDSNSCSGSVLQFFLHPPTVCRGVSTSQASPGTALPCSLKGPLPHPSSFSYSTFSRVVRASGNALVLPRWSLFSFLALLSQFLVAVYN